MERNQLQELYDKLHEDEFSEAEINTSYTDKLKKIIQDADGLILGLYFDYLKNGFNNYESNQLLEIRGNMEFGFKEICDITLKYNFLTDEETPFYCDRYAKLSEKYLDKITSELAWRDLK